MSKKTNHKKAPNFKIPSTDGKIFEFKTALVTKEEWEAVM